MVEKRRYRSDRYRLILVSAVYTCGERLHKIRDRPSFTVELKKTHSNMYPQYRTPSIGGIFMRYIYVELFSAVGYPQCIPSNLKVLSMQTAPFSFSISEKKAVHNLFIHAFGVTFRDSLIYSSFYFSAESQSAPPSAQ